MIHEIHGKKYKCKKISRFDFYKIKISNAFKRTPPRVEKMQKKVKTFWTRFHKLDKIVVDKDYILKDGYCSYLIARDTGYRGRRLKIYMIKEVKDNGDHR